MNGTSAFSNQHTELQSFVQSLLVNVRTTLPARVLEVSNEGGVSPIGTVTLRPLVQQIDAYGKSYNQPDIYNVPYLRIQGGANAVILDPEPGDIGFVAFCDRDISTVKATQADAAPGSTRKHNLADAVYTSSILSASPPEQYIQFHADGITIHSPTQVTVRAPEVLVDSPQSTFTGAVTIQGALTYLGGMTGSGGSGAAAKIQGIVESTGDQVAGGVSQINHVHGGVQRGSSNSDKPQR